ncbi:SPFH domain, Band 7 family protein [Sanguibacter keddieii DSM 10542]|uniref:SPFH domain, Band 7 family protein n=1 Tax=Sanguibacter keddieii (strain ATCC 51767 / DSM 10542 / NCFB 3025 / ST-74) TaxID=446469 RepID=D1BIB2_SANKS|nr:SPFH domain-containing protein [Sanguibacter keddieii]ACZ22089.1 SPFH domain, Band 7 family protein [Sanguibacter keddieii DSM 10542]
MNDGNNGQIIGLVIAALIALFFIIALARAVRVVPQTASLIVERLGRYSRTMDAGLHFLIPFIDRVRAGVDLREQVVSFPPQPVITSDNLVVSIDTVLYFQVTDPKSAVYEIANYITAIEQLTVTTLRNVIGSMDLEQTLTSRDQINGQLRGVLDEATGRWGIRVNRVELKSIDPPQSIQGSMEQQMRAERDRRAAILTAEGFKQSQILTAEGEKQAAILRAEGGAQAAILTAEGEARAILQVFDAIHEGDASPELLAYQYLQMLPQIANGTSSKMWIVPTEFTAALGSITKGFGGDSGDGDHGGGSHGGGDGDGSSPRPRRERATNPRTSALEDPTQALAEARRLAEAATADATSAGTHSGSPTDPSRSAGQQPSGSHGSAPTAPRTLGSEGGGARFAPPAPDAFEKPATPPAPPTPPTAPGQGQPPQQ